MADVNSMCMVGYANNKAEALSIASDANKYACQGKMQYTLVEHLHDNEWLVIIAKNEEYAEEARDKHYKDDEY